MRLRRPKPCPTPGPSFTWRTSRRKPAFVTGTNDQTPKSWNWVRKAEFSRFSCYDSLMHLYCRVQMSLLVVHTSMSCTVKNAHGVNIESLWSNLKVPYSTHLLFASQTQKVVSCIILTPTLLTSTAASSLGRWSPFFLSHALRWTDIVASISTETYPLLTQFAAVGWDGRGQMRKTEFLCFCVGLLHNMAGWERGGIVRRWDLPCCSLFMC